MGQKTHPKGIRLLFNHEEWDSRWYARNKKDFQRLLKEDYLIRKHIKDTLRFAAIARITIERAGNRVRVKIFTGRAGIVIGRKGEALDKLKEDIQKLTKSEVLLDIIEIKKPDLVANIIAEQIAWQIERRVAYKRAMKKAVQTALALGAKGIQLVCSGRLAGADIARTERQSAGSIPRHTLRSHIDYGFAEARTVYGIIGVKCWILGPDEIRN